MRPSHLAPEQQRLGCARSSRSSSRRSSKRACQAPVSSSSTMKSSTARTAAPRPSSARRRSPSFLDELMSCLSEVQRFSALASSSALTLEMCFSSMPPPLTATSRALSNWSNAHGVTTLGMPLRMAAAVVPAPPWCVMAAHWGKSHSCGAVRTKSTRFSAYAANASASTWPSSSDTSSPATPPRTIPRRPACFSARTARQVMYSADTATMEPQPT
mmetsp:Transcript_26205/g.75161  ORF Transcript_26205/g.75161 Transcript_26205/m.75161 type:complete len:215 (+) Transcript_26205:165-809(+)